MEREKHIRAVAARMVDMYRDSPYKPEERAVDHAFSYDDWRRRYWMEVAYAIGEVYDHLRSSDTSAQPLPQTDFHKECA